MSQHISVTHCSVIDLDGGLSAEQLAIACEARVEWVVELAACGIVAAIDEPTRACYGSQDLARARAVRRLQRDFDASLDAAALILDLQHEIHRLRARLLAHGVREDGNG